MVPGQHGFYENLAIWGWDVRDALDKSRKWCQDKVDTHVPFFHRPHIEVSHAGERTGVRTLWQFPKPAEGADATQLTAAKALGEDGGIETLAVFLGANNALGSVLDLKVKWSQGSGYQDLDKKDSYNVWTPDHFRSELQLLVNQVQQIDASHVIWLTVPHVTVSPMARGVGEKPYYSRYFARYTRPWISDQDFDADTSPCLTGNDARAVDAAIDQFNWAIKKHVHDQREAGRDWFILDVCGLLDRVAYRRYAASPGAQPSWWDDLTPYQPLPAEVLAMSPRPDTRFFGSDKFGRNQGGLIALDGVHPTTIGYSIIAAQFLEILTGAVGIQPAGGATGQVDSAALIKADSLNSTPPRLLAEDGRTLGAINEIIDLFEALTGRAPL